MFDFSQPIWINWELNNICNLMCPQCGRNEIKNGIIGLVIIFSAFAISSFVIQQAFEATSTE